MITHAALTGFESGDPLMGEVPSLDGGPLVVRPSASPTEALPLRGWETRTTGTAWRPGTAGGGLPIDDGRRSPMTAGSAYLTTASGQVMAVIPIEPSDPGPVIDMTDRLYRGLDAAGAYQQFTADADQAIAEGWHPVTTTWLGEAILQATFVRYGPRRPDGSFEAPGPPPDPVTLVPMVRPTASGRDSAPAFNPAHRPAGRWTSAAILLLGLVAIAALGALVGLLVTLFLPD